MIWAIYNSSESAKKRACLFIYFRLANELNSKVIMYDEQTYEYEIWFLYI